MTTLTSWLSLAIVLLPFAASHGAMTIPPSRNAGPDASSHGGGCQAGSCFWFNQGCSIGCKCDENNSDFFGNLCGSSQKPTINSAKYRTFSNITDEIMVPEDWTANHPWRAPGTSTPLNSCGLSGGSTKNNDVAGGYGKDTIVRKQGYPGSELPAVNTNTTWVAGQVAEVAWNIAANHGGGYIYRLCPKSSSLTEDCFWQTPLQFFDDNSELRWSDGKKVEISATRVSEGTTPAGTVWSKNPIPACAGTTSAGYHGLGCDKPVFTPPKGCDDTCWGYQPCFEGEFPTGCPNPAIKTREIPQIVDRVLVPSHLEPGEYVVGWRWDCEHTPQIWSGCADVTIVAP